MGKLKHLDGEDDAHDEHLEEMDANKDGKISREEWVKFITPEVEADGHTAEAKKGHMILMEARFDAADEDEDGFVTKEEIHYLDRPDAHVMDKPMLKFATASLKARDTNKDGKLSLEEFK